jgi:hypothetical protein
MRSKKSNNDPNLWVARDLDNGFSGGGVYLFTQKPKRIEKEGYFDEDGGTAIYIGGKDHFTELTWENSPMRVTEITFGAVGEEEEP